MNSCITGSESKQLNGHQFSAKNNLFIILEILFSKKIQCLIFKDVLKIIFNDHLRCS